MILEIRFVGVRASSLLEERVYDLVWEALGPRAEHIQYMQFSIGDVSSPSPDLHTGSRWAIGLVGGQKLGAETDSVSLMPLIEESLNSLNEHFSSESATSRSADQQMARAS